MKKLYPLMMAMAVLVVFGTSAAWAAKEEVCHFPPGNPENFHTITVGGNAVNAHLSNHDDLLGSCLENCEAICDDGNACTIDVEPNPDQCICAAEPREQVDCSDGNVCTADACDSFYGTCTNDPGPLDGATCDDGDPETTNDICMAGVCAGESPVSECPCWTQAELNSLPTAGPGQDEVCFDDPGSFIEAALDAQTSIIYSIAAVDSGNLCFFDGPGTSIFLNTTPEETAACRADIEAFAAARGVTCVRIR